MRITQVAKLSSSNPANIINEFEVPRRVDQAINGHQLDDINWPPGRILGLRLKPISFYP